MRGIVARVTQWLAAATFFTALILIGWNVYKLASLMYQKNVSVEKENHVFFVALLLIVALIALCAWLFADTAVSKNIFKDKGEK